MFNAPNSPTPSASSSSSNYCAVCKKSFSSNATLASHLNSIKHKQAAAAAASKSPTKAAISAAKSAANSPRQQQHQQQQQQQQQYQRQQPQKQQQAQGVNDLSMIALPPQANSALRAVKMADKILDTEPSNACTVYWNVATDLLSMGCVRAAVQTLSKLALLNMKSVVGSDDKDEKDIWILQQKSRLALLRILEASWIRNNSSLMERLSSIHNIQQQLGYDIIAAIWPSLDVTDTTSKINLKSTSVRQLAELAGQLAIEEHCKSMSEYVTMSRAADILCEIALCSGIGSHIASLFWLWITQLSANINSEERTQNAWMKLLSEPFVTNSQSRIADVQLLRIQQQHTSTSNDEDVISLLMTLFEMGDFVRAEECTKLVNTTSTVASCLVDILGAVRSGNRYTLDSLALEMETNANISLSQRRRIAAIIDSLY
ncbi:hypothetical protein GQ42DRAFT_19864 [Ramicandelaber brevisporus]|nr:hypothetical protein GQ42DRAFT_19864 [Ramicandelaber brevisporus]